jgi:hypothetical protein
MGPKISREKEKNSEDLKPLSDEEISHYLKEGKNFFEKLVEKADDFSLPSNEYLSEIYKFSWWENSERDDTWYIIFSLS